MNGTVILATPEQMESHIGELADILIDCVEDGASVTFMFPLDRDTAIEYWRGVLDDVCRKDTVPFLAIVDSQVAGVVLLYPKTLPVQPHVAEVCKLLVPRKFRRQGLARLLMEALESEALKRNRNLLVLDTIKNSSAEKLYLNLGYKLSGIIPNFALLPDGQRCESVILYKQL